MINEKLKQLNSLKEDITILETNIRYYTKINEELLKDLKKD